LNCIFVRHGLAKPPLYSRSLRPFEPNKLRIWLEIPEFRRMSLIAELPSPARNRHNLAIKNGYISDWSEVKCVCLGGRSGRKHVCRISTFLIQTKRVRQKRLGMERIAGRFGSSETADEPVGDRRGIHKRSRDVTVSRAETGIETNTRITI